MGAKNKKRSSKRNQLPVNIPVQVKWGGGSKRTTGVVLDISTDGIKVYTSHKLTTDQPIIVVTLKGDLEFKAVWEKEQDEFAFHYGLELTSESPTIEDIFSSYLAKLDY